MALGGSYQDLFIRKYSDMLSHELQQNGSFLKNLVTIETGMGDRVYFTKLGTVDSYVRSSRYEDKQTSIQTYERRFFTPTLVESDIIVDEMDLVRYASSPQSDLIKAQIMKLGRDLDNIIIGALGGNAQRELNGTPSTVPFAASQEIAVNFNSLNNPSFPALTGDTPLTEGKLLRAKALLQSNYVDSREPIFVVGPASQFSNLNARALGNYGMLLNKVPNINLPGLDIGLDGFLGMHYIASEQMGVNASGDQNVYVFPKSAIKLGEWRALNIDVHKRHDKAGDPTEVTATMGYGAARMFEEKVVRIACDPLA